MSGESVSELRHKADVLCAQAALADAEGRESWPLYSQAGKLRDRAHLLNDLEFYRPDREQAER